MTIPQWPQANIIIFTGHRPREGGGCILLAGGVDVETERLLSASTMTS
jgi:hypothetical protein